MVVIAADRLAFSHLLCTRDNTSTANGFLELCKDSVRFTHAFTTSTSTVPALTSLLTGLWPWESRVRFNSDFLASSTQTLAEFAHANGFRTAMFVGGAPVLRSTNLHQGFQLFEDNVLASAKSPIRPASVTLGLLRDWLLRGRGPALAVAYLPDLGLPQIESRNELGEPRARTQESQLEELDLQISLLVRVLKERKKWHSTHLIVVGMQGAGNPESTKSSSTQISLLIKPASKPRDEGTSWSVDQNVSLRDLGNTLIELVGGPSIKDSSFVAGLKSAQFPLSWDRLVPIESTFRLARGEGPLEWAVRKEQLVTIQSSGPPQVFNSLSDRLETAPLRATDPLAAELMSMTEDYFLNSGWKDSELEPPLGHARQDVTKMIRNCLSLMNSMNNENESKASVCDDRGAAALVQLSIEDTPLRRKSAQRAWALHTQARALRETSEANRLNWNVNPNLGLIRSPIEAVFAHESLAKLRNVISSRAK